MNKQFLRFALLFLFGLLIVTIAAPAPAAAQSGEDWDRVQSAGRIVFGTSADYPPFESYDSNFKLDGFDIALAREMGKRLGIEVEFTDFAFSGLLDALNLGQVDAVISALSVTPNRQQAADFTNLYYIDDDAMLARAADPIIIRSPTDFAGLRVGVERGTVYAYWAQENLVNAGIIPQDALIDYPDTLAQVRGLRSNDIDVAVLERLTALTFTTSAQDLHVVGRGLNQQRFAVATRKGSSLVEKLNQALLSIQADGTYATLVRQYLNDDDTVVADEHRDAEVINIPVRPVEEPECKLGLEFVADLNLDDHNMQSPPIMSPGQPFTKSWRVRNVGACPWEADYSLVYVNGNRVEASMAAAPLPIGHVVQPGETIDLSMSLIAPVVYGTYQGFFQMRDNTGKLFGQVIWAGIQVPDPNPPPTPTPVPAPPNVDVNPNLRADSTWINQGQCTAIRWDVDNVNAIYFVDGGSVQGVGGHDARTVCPGQTANYVLRITRRDNATVEFPITINVSGPPPQRPGPRIDRFWVSSTGVRAGECIRFEWRAVDADGVNLYLGDKRKVSGGPREGSWQDCPSKSGPHEYKLEAYGNGSTKQKITVYVQGGGGGGGRDE